MSRISVSNLTFYYEGSYDNIFEEVSFQIDTDWKLGFIARNGKGKTTFLKLLMNQYEYKGTITASVLFDYFPFEVSNKDRNTIEVIEAVTEEYEFWKLCRELTLLQVDTEVLYRAYSTLSNGEQTKVLLALLFSRDNHFLLIDEPTNHLDMETREIVKQYLNEKKGYILVSHDRNFMDGCVDHVLVINKENIEVQQGNFSSWWENKQRQDAFELSENEKLKKDIRRLDEAAKQAHKWAEDVEATKIGKKSLLKEKNIDSRAYAGEKSRRMQMRRKNLENRKEGEIEDKSKLLKNLETIEDLKIISLRHYKDKLVMIENAAINYGDTEILSDLSLEISQGERILLQGKNGCGKSSVIKAILQSNGMYHQTDLEGRLILSRGGIEIPNGVKISYVSQDTSLLKGTLKEYALWKEIDYTLLLALLKKLDFSRIQFEKKIEEYSGGQKKKVLIAGSLCEQAHLYIWDEPLNFIDVFSRMQIEALILKFEPTMIMVEHDRIFTENTATRIFNL